MILKWSFKARLDAFKNKRLCDFVTKHNWHTFARLNHDMYSPSLMPWNTKDFAPSIWHKMYVNSLRTVQSAYSRSFDVTMI